MHINTYVQWSERLQRAVKPTVIRYIYRLTLAGMFSSRKTSKHVRWEKEHIFVQTRPSAGFCSVIDGLR